jgi:hypothetical protein
MDIPERKQDEEDRIYVKRVLRALRKRPRFRLTPLSRQGRLEDELPLTRIEEQRRRATAAYEPDDDDQAEREPFDEERLRARESAISFMLAPDGLPVDPGIVAFVALSGPGMAEAMTDPEVALHYAVFRGRSHPELAVTRIAAGPITDWLMAGRAWILEGMTGERPMPADLKESLIDHALGVMEAVEGRSHDERHAELAAEVSLVPFREAKTIRSGWREGSWEDAPERPDFSARFMAPDDPRFWELLHESEQRRERWEALKHEQERRRSKRKEFVISKGPSGVVTAGPRRKRRKKSKRRK